MNNEGAGEPSSSLASCLNREPGCAVGSPTLESAGEPTWVWLSMPRPVALAFLVLVMLSGRSPNLKT